MMPITNAAKTTPPTTPTLARGAGSGAPEGPERAGPGDICSVMSNLLLDGPGSMAAEPMDPEHAARTARPGSPAADEPHPTCRCHPSEVMPPTVRSPGQWHAG